MATITALEIQKKDNTRCSVYVDGTFYCGLKMEVAIKHRLKVGMEIDENFLNSIQFDSECTTALDRALTHLSATLKTTKQMVDFLSSKGYTQGIIDYVLEKLLSYGYLDDRAYAKAYVNSVNGKGKAYLSQQLKLKGVPSDVVEEVLQDIEEDEDEVLLIAKKYLKNKPLDRQNVNKCFKYLLSKGFSFDIIKSALYKLGEDNDEDY